MRAQKVLTLLATSAAALTLAACQTVGPSTSPVATSSSTTGSTSGTTGSGTNTTPTGSGGTATSTTSTTVVTPSTDPAKVPATLGTLVDSTTFNTASVTTNHHQWYAGGQRYTAINPVGINDKVKITRNPRDATYNVEIAAVSGIELLTGGWYQDPAHRTTYFTAGDGVTTQDRGAAVVMGHVPAGTLDKDLFSLVPNITNTEYYASGRVSGEDGVQEVEKKLFFTERKGDAASVTQYVTWAAYWQFNATGAYLPAEGTNERKNILQRTAAIYGFNTLARNVPSSGSANYAGVFYADMIEEANYYTLWGQSNFAVNFANNSGTMSLNGSVVSAYAPSPPTTRLGQAFLAGGNLILNRPSTAGTSTLPVSQQPIGTLSGTINSLKLGGVDWTYMPNATGTRFFQASSIDGGFFGPSAEEIGVSFRIVGGEPNNRLDITGVATGRKQ